MSQQIMNENLPILKSKLPQYEIEDLDSSDSRITEILESGERIFKEIRKLTGKEDSTQTGTAQPQNGQDAFKVPSQAKNAFNTVASYVGWGGAAVGTVLLIRKILK